MKNPRNTRRGRAKRWRTAPLFHGLKMTCLRPRTGIWVEPNLGIWFCIAWDGKAMSDHPSKAAAMRCAEAWDRLFRDERRRQRKDGFALAA